ncbi:MAG: hypothetical protein SWE60_23500, partial [Thermodesulfobacteriota bacterium]|nr:hypothetical protein [Thermodesulfobacteriota bacterium]
VRKLMLMIQHRLNPLHLYCRLVEWGLNNKRSMSMCKWYQKLIYGWLTRFSVATVRLCDAFKAAT